MVTRGSTLSITCKSTSNPSPPTYTWTLPGSTIQTGASLSITDIQPSRSGQYQLLVWNSMTPTGGTSRIGTSDATFTLDVLYEPTTPVCTYSYTVLAGVIIVTRGSTLFITCNSTSNPSPPSYTWILPDSTIQTGVNLRITDIQPSRSGQYRLLVWNRMTPTDGTSRNGTSDAIFTVEVQSAACDCNATDCTVSARAAGTYVTSASGTSGCATCPACHYCTGGSATACGAGTYNSATGSTAATACISCYSEVSAAGASTCVPCTAGFRCPDTIFANKAARVSPMYSLEGEKTCNSCPTGYYCPTASSAPLKCSAGKEPTSARTRCQDCSSGYYSDGSFCAVCPPGHKCAGTGLADPVACSSGEYQSSTGRTSCRTYPAESHCADKTIAPVSCSVGTFSAASATSCSVCPTGYYSASGASSCTQCTAGYYCTVTTQTVCGLGKYSSAGFTACTTCPAGNKCETTTTASPTQCLVGTYAAAGASICTACEAGKKCPTNGMDAAVSCHSGEYQPSTGQSSCMPCPAGQQCLTVSTATDCNKGFYSPAGSMVCTECLDGTYADAVKSAHCTTCPAGSECTDKTAAPVACPPGEYSSAGQKLCSQCGAGTCKNTSGVGSCVPCQAESQEVNISPSPLATVIEGQNLTLTCSYTGSTEAWSVASVFSRTTLTVCTVIKSTCACAEADNTVVYKPVCSDNTIELTVINVHRSRNHEVWKCEMKIGANYFYSGTTQINVAALAKPDIPRYFHYTQNLQNQTSLKFYWLPGYNGGYVQSFYIEYKKTGSQVWDQVSVVEDSSVPLMKATVDNLSPATEYQARMFARNKIGDSDSTDKVTFTILDCTQSNTHHSVSQIEPVVGGVVGGVVLVLIIAALAYVRLNNNCIRKGLFKLLCKKTGLISCVCSVFIDKPLQSVKLIRDDTFQLDYIC
ncbi:major surface trophozoite antigen 11-like [Dreissena polymorpha]|uniref:major surface trophozoite antigen 11-like n=1 Tax=Dreissena polymorpha TaxID=45954 RepID=UPI002264D5C4|nr:major surface trophozoite antigen 11-like [Dreissena polymorpha]